MVLGYLERLTAKTKIKRHEVNEPLWCKEMQVNYE